MRNKHQVIDAPCEAKVSRTVLEARQGGDSLSLASGQRLDWLRRTRCQIDRCSLISEPIGEIPDKVDYYSQAADLKETK
ncbi:hypothetical protein [Microseira sp. BLCC-F43]|uniref:hypothetical protein n=1 Tax=Microseira sp. BLCC-F43 TaxID=3153602 RepID=UPI0035B7B9FC